MGNRSSNRQHQGFLCPSETDLTDFQLVKFIGAGTFGKVYIVLHKGLKKEYALKVMCKRRICRRKFAENVLRFLLCLNYTIVYVNFNFSELELLQGLSHPFISSLWYAFQDNEQIYMISDLLLGGDLAYHLKNHGRFSESRAKLMICELALALDYLHRQRIGHFDVKPANILLDEQGHAHLSDFGLAKRLAEGKLAATFSGTRHYMAPEILLTALGNIAGYDWRVDWWALGACFYELLRGRTPFSYPASFSSLQVLSIIYTRGVTMPSRWPSDLIAFLRAIINPDQQCRIDTFEKIQGHPYMERIKWKDVFDRKMIPIFVPPKEQLDSFSRRNYRATVSAVPLSSHRIGGHHRHLFRHLHTKEGSEGSERAESSHKELEEEVAKLSARFKKYNRFRCETQIAAPRQSLDLLANKERRRLPQKTRPPAKNSGNFSARLPNDTSAGMPLTQAEKMRRTFQANNRDVNYSL